MNPVLMAPRPVEAAQADADNLSALAVWALLEEAELTPKPALADRRGSGAHHDLDLARLRRSAESLRDGFAAVARAAAGQQPSLRLREQLGRIGREMEARMLEATGASNAHRGAIWALGLLIAAAAQRTTRAATQAPNASEGTIRRWPHAAAGAEKSQGPTGYLSWPPTVPAVRDGRSPRLRSGLVSVVPAPGDHAADTAALAAALARLPERFARCRPSNGQRACLRYGAAGARGEAQAAFPHATLVGLPALRAARGRGIPEERARLDALMAIMAGLDDTCLLHRGGRPGLQAAKTGARAVLAAGGTATPAGMDRLHRLHDDLMARWASPGGSADLLAVTLFLDRLEDAFGRRHNAGASHGNVELRI
jgi:triphosphoribosyl-dephospho-CoA synthase